MWLLHGPPQTLVEHVHDSFVDAGVYRSRPLTRMNREHFQSNPAICTLRPLEVTSCGKKYIKKNSQPTKQVSLAGAEWWRCARNGTEGGGAQEGANSRSRKRGHRTEELTSWTDQEFGGLEELMGAAWSHEIAADTPIRFSDDAHRAGRTRGRGYALTPTNAQVTFWLTRKPTSMKDRAPSLDDTNCTHSLVKVVLAACTWRSNSSR